MIHQTSFSARKARLLNRMQARLSANARAATAFVSAPEPRTIGSFAKGRQLMAGNYLFAGHLVTAQGIPLWDIDAPAPEFTEEIHGFSWLDDLASVGDILSRSAAADWVWDWIERYGNGTGPGWTPDLTGRRLIRWINHAIFLLRGQEPDKSKAFYQSLAQQTRFLSKRWHSTVPGLPRFEALTGLIYAGMALEGQESLAEHAIKAMDRECDNQLNDEGGLPTRNPEELLD